MRRSPPRCSSPPKTVETHIRNLFTKLGVSSRVEIARIVERAR
jgi:DNA-binding CsgD family transcriptional regulator